MDTTEISDDVWHFLEDFELAPFHEQQLQKYRGHSQKPAGATYIASMVYLGYSICSLVEILSKIPRPIIRALFKPLPESHKYYLINASYDKKPLKKYVVNMAVECHHLDVDFDRIPNISRAVVSNDFMYVTFSTKKGIYSIEQRLIKPTLEMRTK